MGPLTIGIIFAAALTVALIWGVRWAYVAVFLPTLILLNQIPPFNLQHAPVLAQYAPMYAILIALPFRGESLRFRPCLTDGVILLLVLSTALTGWTTEYMETGVNGFRNDLLRLAMPYFLARIVFRDWRMRRAALKWVVALLALISVCALIETHGQPYFFLHLLQRMGYRNSIHLMAYGRFGLVRVSGPVEHPIFFGNMNIVILGLVAVLARTSGVSLSKPYVAVALFAAFGCVVVSFSYTPWMGLVAGAVGLAVLMRVPLARRLVLPLTLAAITAGFGYTYHMAKSPLGEKPDAEFLGSLYTRKLIIQQSWRLAETAGPFGYGLRADFSDQDDFDLASVDNSYMQFTMTRGWVYTALWLGIGITFAARVGKAFRVASDPAQVFPLAVCTSTVLGLMVSMYTVWAGALYTVVWIIMVGLGNTLIDAVYEAAEARGRLPSAGVGSLRPPTVRFAPRGGLAVR